MKITKQELKQIIEEEMSAPQARIKTAYEKTLEFKDPQNYKQQLEWEAKVNKIAELAGFNDYEALEKAYFARVKGFTGRKHRGDVHGPERAYGVHGPEYDIKENKLTKSKLKQIVQEELENSLKEIAIVLGDKEDLGKAGPWPVKDVSTPEKAEKAFADVTKSVQGKEETVGESLPQGAHRLPPGWATKEYPEPKGPFRAGYETYDSLEDAIKYSSAGTPIIDGNGNQVDRRFY